MTSLDSICGLVDALVLSTLAALHVAWAFGVRTGAAAAIPERNGAPLFRPGPLACLTVAAALLTLAALVLARIGALATPMAPSLVRAMVLAGAGAFGLRAIGERRYLGIFKTVRDTAFARIDTRVYSPLCAGLAVTLAVAGW